MNCRKRMIDVRTGRGGHPGMSMGGVLKSGPCGIRLEGGVTLDQALLRNRRTCRPGVKEERQVEALQDVEYQDWAQGRNNP